MDELTNALRRLAEIRAMMAKAEERRGQAQAELETTLEWDNLIEADDRVGELARQESEAKFEADRLNLLAYEATGDKHPARGADIAVYRKVECDPAKMLAWCEEHRPSYVVRALDTKRVNKNAEDLVSDGAPLGIVEEPRSRIATDLSHYLPKPEPPAAPAPSIARLLPDIPDGYAETEEDWEDWGD